MKKFVWSTVNEIRKIRIRIIKELELGKNVIVTGKPIVKAIKGANTTILPGVTIGKGSVIGTGSVVTKDIPPMCFAAGFPAKVIKQYPISSH